MINVLHLTKTIQEARKKFNFYSKSLQSCPGVYFYHTQLKIKGQGICHRFESVDRLDHVRGLTLNKVVIDETINLTEEQKAQLKIQIQLCKNNKVLETWTVDK